MKKLARLSMLLAISITLSVLESMIPVFGGLIPGLKIGLANIVVVFVLYKYSFKEAFVLSILRVFLVGILRTGLFSVGFFLSLSGALLSLIMMWLSKKLKLSIIGTSIVGATFHSVGQILMAMILINNTGVLYYLPILLLGSVIAGLFIGIISKQLVKYFENI